MENKDLISGMGQAIENAEELVSNYGIPICDYKVYSNQFAPLKTRFKKAIDRAKQLNNLQSTSQFHSLIM